MALKTVIIWQDYQKHTKTGVPSKEHTPKQKGWGGRILRRRMRLGLVVGVGLRLLDQNKRKFKCVVQELTYTEAQFTCVSM